ncbi:MAG: sporulation protein [Bacteroidota bacterium]
MFGRVKNWLGIEGVKVELDIPEEVRAKDKVIAGKLMFISMNTQTVTKVTLRLVEKYMRGRGDERLVDEYSLGSIVMEKSFEVEANQPAELEFELPFDLVNSDVDSFERKNFIAGGIAKLAKLAYNVKSTYRVEVEAKVKGTALNPFDKQNIIIK